MYGSTSAFEADVLKTFGSHGPRVIQSDLDGIAWCPAERRRYWQLPAVSESQTATELPAGAFIGCSQVFTGGKWLVVSAFLSTDGSWDVVAISAIDRSLKILLEQRDLEPILAPAPDASDRVWAVFWKDLIDFHSRAIDLSVYDVAPIISDIRRRAWASADGQEIPGADDPTPMHVRRIIASIIRFHRVHLDHTITAAVLRGRHRGLMFYSLVARERDSEERRNLIGAVKVEPFTLGMSARILYLRNAHGAQLDRSWDGDGSFDWPAVALELLDAAKKKLPLRAVIQSRFGYQSAESIRYLNSLGLHDIGIDEYELVRVFVVDALPPEHRPLKWRTVEALLPLLRYLRAEMRHFEDARVEALVGRTLVAYYCTALLSFWRMYGRLRSHENEWVNQQDIDKAKAVTSGFVGSTHPVDAAIKHLPLVAEVILRELSRLPIRRRLNMEIEWNGRLTGLDSTVSAAMVYSDRVRRYRELKPLTGADVPLPVSLEWIRALELDHRGWKIDLLDSLPKILALGNRLENCLAATGSGCHLMEWVELRFIFIKLVDPSGVPSLLEVDMFGSLPWPNAVQHRGLRNTEPSSRHQVIGENVVYALQNHLVGEVENIWRAEHEHVQSLRRPLTSQEREMAVGLEAERLFIKWELAPRLLSSPVISGGFLSTNTSSSPEESH